MPQCAQEALWEASHASPRSPPLTTLPVEACPGSSFDLPTSSCTGPRDRDGSHNANHPPRGEADKTNMSSQLAWPTGKWDDRPARHGLT